MDGREDPQTKLPDLQPPALHSGLEGAGRAPSTSPPGRCSCPWATGLDTPFPCPVPCAVCPFPSSCREGVLPPEPSPALTSHVPFRKRGESREGSVGRPGHLDPSPLSRGSSPQFLLVPPLSQVPNSHNLLRKLLRPLWGSGSLVEPVNAREERGSARLVSFPGGHPHRPALRGHTWKPCTNTVTQPPPSTVFPSFDWGAKFY